MVALLALAAARKPPSHQPPAHKPPPRPAAPLTPMDACRRAIAEAESIDPRARALHVQGGCGALYEDQNCRGAWYDVADPRRLFPDRYAHLQKWCGDLWCKWLPYPVPKACLPRGEATEETWLELNRAGLKLERDAGPGLADELMPFFREPPDAGWPEPVLEVRVGEPAATVRVNATDGGASAWLPLTGLPDGEQLVSVRRILAPHCRGVVTVRADRSLPMRVITPLMGAAADAGCAFQEFNAR